MKRTPLKRSTKGLSRGAPIKPGRPLARGQRLAPGPRKATNSGGLARRSAARTKQMAEDRVPYIRALIEAGVTCEICPMLEEHDITTHCAGRIEGLHERRKSSSGGSRINRAGLVPCCNWSNGWVEDFPKLCRDLFGDALVVRESDPEWDRLSKRNDRGLDTD